MLTLYTRAMGFCLNEETSLKLSLKQVFDSLDRLRRRCIRWGTKSWPDSLQLTLVGKAALCLKSITLRTHVRNRIYYTYSC